MLRAFPEKIHTVAVKDIHDMETLEYSLPRPDEYDALSVIDVVVDARFNAETDLDFAKRLVLACVALTEIGE